MSLKNNNNSTEDLLQQLEACQAALAQCQRENELLKTDNTYLEKLLSLMPGHLFWKSRDGVYQLCNNRMADVLQLENRKAIKGKTVFDLIETSLAQMVQKIDEDIMRKGLPISLEEEGVDEEGQPAIYLTKKVPVYNNQGTVSALFGLSIDITERKRIERELETAKAKAEISSQAKSDFIYNMSHDLRTPFSGILGFAYHLYDIETDSAKKAELSYIIQSSEKLLALLNDILHVARDNMDSQFVNSNFDLINLLSDCRALFSAEIERKQLFFNIDYPHPHLYLCSDKHRLYRILVNLLSNAIKFTQQGGVTLAVHLETVLEQDYLIVSVSDTGPGINKDKHEIIFERFTRLTSSYHGNHPGTGIGLWFVKKLLTDLDGDIEVKSEPGQGATFVVRLPITLCHERDISRYPSRKDDYGSSDLASVAMPSQRYQGKRLLMVEDDEITQKMQMLILRELGFEITLATTGRQALDVAAREVFDVIFMDIGLPDMDGFEVARIMRLACQPNIASPIIGLTAHIGQVEQLKWQHQDINQLIMKPLTKAVVCNILELPCIENQ